jgi:hypothetical protein
MAAEGGAAAQGERPTFQQGFPIPKSIMGRFAVGRPARSDCRCSFIRFGVAVGAPRGAGFIIGSGGRNIDQIEKASGAKLSVSDRNGPDSFGKEWVYVQVSCERISTVAASLSLSFSAPDAWRLS